MGERRDRLKKHFGIDVGPGDAKDLKEPNFSKKSSCLDEIEKLKVQREERRARMEDIKRDRKKREDNN